MTWRWPWVSRARLDAAFLAAVRADALIEDLKRREEVLSDACARTQERYERLVERTITMQREGFSVVKPPAEDAPAKPFPALIEQAIADRGFDPITDRKLRHYAAQALSVPHADPEAVAGRILAGETLDEELTL